MSTETTNGTDRENREIVLKHTFDAPRETVFKAWTDPDHLTQWWGPKGFDTPRNKITVDLHAGGQFNLVMVLKSAEIAAGMGVETGTEFPDQSEIVEIAEPERLVLRHAAQPEIGLLEPTITRIEFYEEGDKTRIRLTSGPYTEDMAPNAETGWSQSFDKLDALLAS